jgi:hypothetical protein
MALAVQEARVDCRIHCFDSFCGFPKASVKDDADWQARLGVGSSQEPSKPLDPAWGFSTKQTVERVSENFRKWGFSPEMFVFHEGWFQDTIPGWREPIAVLRIDGDIYESTLVCLAELYPWLSDGGICILDDYNTVNGCRLACDEYFQNSVQPILVKDGGGPVWWIKGR